MHHEEIKAAIRMRGTTPSMIAVQLGLSRATVAQVIKGTGRSARVEQHICKLLGKTVNDLWPDRAKPLPNAKRAKAKAKATASSGTSAKAPA